MLVARRSVNDENLCDAGLICEGRTRIWGCRPPDPPLNLSAISVAAPQTPRHKGLFVGSLTRYALASQWESICGLGFIFWDGSKTRPGVINQKSLSRTHVKLLNPISRSLRAVCGGRLNRWRSLP
jgi:hypothetical protein